MGGCRKEPDPGALFREAEAHYLAGRFMDAIPLLKQCLCQRPDHAGAHLYLGSCYALCASPSPYTAQGELETALAWFKRNGSVSPIPRFSDKYFELRCHLELAKVYLSLLVQARQGPPALMDAILRKCRDTLAAARAVDANAPETAELERLLGAFDELRPYRQVPPRTPPRNTSRGSQSAQPS